MLVEVGRGGGNEKFSKIENCFTKMACVRVPRSGFVKQFARTLNVKRTLNATSEKLEKNLFSYRKLFSGIVISIHGRFRSTLPFELLTVSE